MTEKAKFLKKFNEAFAEGDIDFVLDQMTDDIHWNIIGDKEIKGKVAVRKALKKMAPDQSLTLTLDQIITHGREAAARGTLNAGKGNAYAFCDTYEFSGFKNPKIKKMVSFVIKTNKPK